RRRRVRTCGASSATLSQPSPASRPRTAVGTDVFAVTPAELRAELAADLARGGYVYGEDPGGDRPRYFDEYLVLSRPGILTRAAKFLAELVPPECERIAVTGIASAVVG